MDSQKDAHWVLDYLSFMHEDAYRLLFGCSALFILMTLYFTCRVDYEGHVEGGKREDG